MNEIIQEGKTRDEALRTALEKLGATPDEVEVEVIGTSKEGFLGLFGTRSVRLCVRRKGAPSASIPTAHYQAPTATIEPPEPAHEEYTTEDIDEEEIQPITRLEDLPELFKPDYTPEDHVHALLSQIFFHMGAECTVRVHEGQNDIYVEVGGKDSGVVIGKFGQTLESVQYLANVILSKKANCKKKIVLDVGDYRDRREQSVRRLARSVARKVIKNRKDEALAPMSPQDRRIVHLALANYRHIKTSSEGSGQNRKVIISFKD